MEKLSHASQDAVVPKSARKGLPCRIARAMAWRDPLHAQVAQIGDDGLELFSGGCS